MQFKSLSYGHFPLNLLEMSAPETLGLRPHRTPSDPGRRAPVRAQKGGEGRGFATHGGRQRAPAAVAPAHGRCRIGLSRA